MEGDEWALSVALQPHSEIEVKISGVLKLIILISYHSIKFTFFEAHLDY